MIYLSETLPPEAAAYFEERGETVSFVRAGAARGAVAAHPDIYLCRVGDELLRASDDEVRGGYPQNAAFCALVLDGYFVHNLKITAPRLLAAAERAGLTPVSIRQGYAKCACALVDGRSVITADEGVARALEKLPGVSVLRVSPGHILLPGHAYGFIGGASALLGKTLVFFGDITAHPDCERIRGFAEARGVKLRWFPFPLADHGGMVC
ncbi:MAG: hypothetical protein IK136_05280 [Oscillospiraceae bacterium]|nr:hypothetical protein [Oscillospiraceae bacterium]